MEKEPIIIVVTILFIFIGIVFLTKIGLFEERIQKPEPFKCLGWATEYTEDGYLIVPPGYCF